MRHKNGLHKTDHQLNKQVWHIVGLCLLICTVASAEIIKSATCPIPEQANAEIIAYHSGLNLLLATDTVRRGISFFQPMLDKSSPSITSLDTFVPLHHEPTSVAVHPSLPLGFCVILDEDPHRNGQLVMFDLRVQNRGKIIQTQPLCTWPDSIAISADGAWMVVANEAEGDEQTAGEILCISLAHLANDDTAWQQPLNTLRLGGLEERLKKPIGQIEPEYVCIEPQSRLAAVSCQENDAVVLVDLRGIQPCIDGTISLPDSSEPDGVALLDGVLSPNGAKGILLGIAEEGRKNTAGKRQGQSAAFYWIDPDNPSAAVFCSRIQISTITGLPEGTRCDPEGIVLKRMHDRVLAFIGLERLDKVVILDVTDLASPRYIHSFQTGSRPEGILTIENNDALFIITANEAMQNAGSITLAWIPAARS
jgi:hypothetical protein